MHPYGDVGNRLEFCHRLNSIIGVEPVLVQSRLT
jgi:hypothetical protein